MIQLGYATTLSMLTVATFIGALLGATYDPQGRNWLPEAGCFVVLLGIWSSVGVLIRERLLIRALTIRERILSARIHRKYRKSVEERERFIHDLRQSYARRLEGVHDRFRLGIGAIEASLIVIGTAVWGFGHHVPLA